MLSEEQRYLSGIRLPSEPPRHQCFELPTASPERFIAAHRDNIVGTVLQSGWALLRGANVKTEMEFAACMHALGMCSVTRYPELTVRTESAQAQHHAPVFDVTPIPADEAIQFHHEGAHTANPCHWIAFHCARSALSGGQTPLVDGAALWLRLPPQLRQAFANKDLIYERHFIEALDVSWQRFFGTADRAVVHSLCALEGMTVVFDGDQVRTCMRRPATQVHPMHRIPVFFNQIMLHHEACLDPEVREALGFALAESVVPRSVRFSDGSAIPDEWIALIADLYIELAEGVSWQNGDFLVVDNFRFAHARCPYGGARQHHAMLGHPPTKPFSIGPST
jgi:alpha-ketoglutarate-dependent taurine dioxygenase